MLPLLVLCARLWLDARRELGAAAVAAQHADERAVRDRVEALGRAARLWLPVGPSHTARLELARLARQGTDGAWTELRASILATRWLMTPDAELLDEADHALAEQRARRALDVGDKTQLEPAAVAAQRDVELALLSSPREPRRSLCVLALAGLCVFLVGAARALAGHSRQVLVGAVGFALFVVGLAYA